MKILAKPIQDFSFEDIVEFCKEQVPEGVEVDYKREYSQKGFAKHFAAFANTRGGVIVLGVEEDRTSGIPIKWEGVKDDAKLKERILQEAANVDPLPSVEVHKTNPVKGKVFFLIRVLQGDKPPHYVKNDPNIWIRTGNITLPIDISSPEGQELLFEKRDKADKRRQLLLDRAENIYTAGLEREEDRRQELIQEAEQREEGGGKHFHQHPLGTHTVMCSITVLPFNPSRSLMNPADIKSRVQEFEYTRGYDSFPDRNLRSIPEGVMYFSHGYDGSVECHQIYSQGLLRASFDVLRPDRETGKKHIYIAHIATYLFMLLQAAKNFYNLTGYQGSVNGEIDLERGPKDVKFKRISMSGRYLDFDFESPPTLNLNYRWEFELDTQVLNSNSDLLQFYCDLVKKIHWSLGYENISDELIMQYLKGVRLIPQDSVEVRPSL